MAYNVGIRNNNLVPTQNGRVFAPGLENRMQNQNGRIAQGLASGSISAEEQTALQGSTAAYRADLAEAKASGGVVGPRERHDLHQQLNGISGQIYGYKHD